MSHALALPPDTDFPRRALPVVAAAVLLLFVLHGWAPALLDRGAVPTAASGSASAADRTLIPVPGEPGSFRARGGSYTASFDATGFSYAPTWADGALDVSLRSMARGTASLPVEPGAWRADGDVASRPVAPAVSEQVTTRQGEVEWDVVLDRRPAGAGELVVRADLAGVASATPQADGKALRVRLTDGTELRLGQTVVLDAAGVELHRSLPTVGNGTIELRVPGAALDAARYPVVVDPTVSAPVTVTSGDRAVEAIAFDGTNFLVVWTQGVQGVVEVWGARVSGDGKDIGAPFEISASNGRPSRKPDVAWGGESFLVVWEEEYANGDLDIQGQRVSTAGARLGGVITVSVGTFQERDPAVTGTPGAGGYWFVTWYDGRNASFDIYAARVSAAGPVLDPSGIPIATDAKQESAPDVAFNGTDFIVAYTFQYSSSDLDILARRVSTAGLAFGPTITIDSSTSREAWASVATDGSGFFVAWESGPFGGGTNLRGQRLDPTGAPAGARTLVSTAAGDQTRPQVAYNGAYLVTWLDQRNGDKVYAGRVQTDGVALDGDGFEIGTTSSLIPVVTRAPGEARWAIASDEGFSPRSILLRFSPK